MNSPVTSKNVSRFTLARPPCILRFFYLVSDGATANRQIPDRIFWSIFYQFKEGYASIWTVFSPTVRGLDVLYNTLSIS